jgi:UDP-N-acetylglucosamine:LPS N-acetylglucosamine transferase
MDKKKVLSVASIGGHWVQLLRISKCLEKRYDVAYCSTHAKCATMVSGHPFFQIEDFSRWDAWKLPSSLISLIGVIRKVHPAAVITTGAAPGLVALFAAKLCGVKTIWIDSVANVEHLSASGRVARKFADRVYTQWENLSTDNIYYKGNIFG